MYPTWKQLKEVAVVLKKILHPPVPFASWDVCGSGPSSSFYRAQAALLLSLLHLQHQMEVATSFSWGLRGSLRYSLVVQLWQDENINPNFLSRTQVCVELNTFCVSLLYFGWITRLRRPCLKLVENSSRPNQVSFFWLFPLPAEDEESTGISLGAASTRCIFVLLLPDFGWSSESGVCR